MGCLWGSNFQTNLTQDEVCWCSVYFGVGCGCVIHSAVFIPVFFLSIMQMQLCWECCAVPLGQLWLDKVIYVLEDVRPDVPIVLCAFQVCLCINHNDAREISQQHFHQQGGRRGADLFRVAGGGMFNGGHTCSRRESGGMVNGRVTWSRWEFSAVPQGQIWFSCISDLFCIHSVLLSDMTLVMGSSLLHVSSLLYSFCPTLRCSSGDRDVFIISHLTMRHWCWEFTVVPSVSCCCFLQLWCEKIMLRV